MKLSIIKKNSQLSWTPMQIMESAAKQNVKSEVVDFDPNADLRSQTNKLGDIIIWRSSSLDIKSERMVFGLLTEDKIVVNKAVMLNPYISFKYYQQNLVANKSKVRTIPTYRFKKISNLRDAIKDGRLQYPFIAKPNYGSQGKGVLLIHNAKEATQVKSEMGSYIFQNYIKNSGDWRIIVIGGKAIGVMKRHAKKGSYLNNISQGGYAEQENDPKICSNLIDMATNIASTFGLLMCGVDIIKDDLTGEYYFLEVNTAPEWDGENGFQSITGVNVSDELIKVCKKIYQRKNKTTESLVQDYFDTFYDSLEGKQFHYASRLYLWTGEDKYHSKLKSLKKEYLGNTSTEKLDMLKNINNSNMNSKISKLANRAYYFKKYKKLKKYNRFLFKTLFAETIYQEDIRDEVSKLVSNEDFIDLYKKLMADHDAIKVLSTHAINYFYNLNYYFKNNAEYFEMTEVDPGFLLGLVKTFDGQINGRKISKDHELKLKLYLLTHVIIGASNFYSKKVKGFVYRQMIQLTEDMIYHNYFDVTLDNKLEFLVCASLCDMDSFLRPLIEKEANESLSEVGNFLVDTINNTSDGKVRHKMSQAEHRNVLYLMSQKEFVHSERNAQFKKSKIKLKSDGLTVIGRRTLISFVLHGIKNVVAKVDTGADYSAIHCDNIREYKKGGKNYIAFRLLYPAYTSYKDKDIVTTKYDQVNVRNTTGELQKRYVVRLKVNVNGREFTTPFTLADRSRMNYPVLLGRRALSNNFLIDTSKLTTQDK